MTVWAAETALEPKMELPFGKFTGAAAAAIDTTELTVHSWDLASATGQWEALDDELAEAGMADAIDVLPPDRRRGDTPFARVTPVAGDAAPCDRLVAFLGRQIG